MVRKTCSSATHYLCDRQIIGGMKKRYMDREWIGLLIKPANSFKEALPYHAIACIGESCASEQNSRAGKSAESVNGKWESIGTWSLLLLYIHTCMYYQGNLCGCV